MYFNSPWTDHWCVSSRGPVNTYWWKKSWSWPLFFHVCQWDTFFPHTPWTTIWANTLRNSSLNSDKPCAALRWRCPGNKLVDLRLLLEAMPGDPVSLAGSSGGERPLGRTGTPPGRSPPRCRRSGSGCGARWPRCSARRWVQPPGFFSIFGPPLLS